MSFAPWNDKLIKLNIHLTRNYMQYHVIPTPNLLSKHLITQNNIRAAALLRTDDQLKCHFVTFISLKPIGRSATRGQTEGTDLDPDFKYLQ